LAGPPERGMGETNSSGWVDLGTGLVNVAGYGKVNTQGNVKNDFTNFAPRLGIAYEATPKTVVRMGYGRSFDIGVFGSIFGHTATQNLPVLVAQQLNPSSNAGSVFDLSEGPPAPPSISVPASGQFLLPDQAGGKGANWVLQEDTSNAVELTQCVTAEISSSKAALIGSQFPGETYAAENVTRAISQNAAMSWD
jgi:outer membrane receptor protein involved in Fe transport